MTSLDKMKLVTGVFSKCNSQSEEVDDPLMPVPQHKKNKLRTKSHLRCTISGNVPFITLQVSNNTKVDTINASLALFFQLKKRMKT